MNISEYHPDPVVFTPLPDDLTKTTNKLSNQKQTATLENTLIQDYRLSTNFGKASFSGFKSSEVRNQLHKTIISGKIEDSLYWSTEMICSGHFVYLWELIFHIMSKNIHIGNPKLPIYLFRRSQKFKEIVMSDTVTSELSLRNNATIRSMMSEIITVLCISRKKSPFSPLQIKDIDFDITEIKYRLKADSLNYGSHCLSVGDSQELMIPVNELAYSLHINNLSSSDAMYWIEWMIHYVTRCKKSKKPCICAKRSEVVEKYGIQEKYDTDISWLIWDVFMNSIENQHPHPSLHLMNNKKQNHKIPMFRKLPILRNILESLKGIFSLRYSSGTLRKRKYIFYFAIYLLTDPISNTIPLVENIEKVKQYCDNIHCLYREIKKNEIPVNPMKGSGSSQSNVSRENYLFHDLE